MMVLNKHHIQNEVSQKVSTYFKDNFKEFQCHMNLSCHNHQTAIPRCEECSLVTERGHFRLIQILLNHLQYKHTSLFIHLYNQHLGIWENIR
jgi:hypothetical protein